MLLGGVVFLPFVAALIGYGIGRVHKKGRDIFAVVATALELAAMVALLFPVARGGVAQSGESTIRLIIPDILGMGLYFAADGFRVLYGTIAALMWFVSTLFSREYFAHYRNRNRYYLFLLFTLGATMGVFFSADFFTTFVFFEIMSFTSYVWVAHDERKESLRAGETYLAVAVIGGLVMLMGIFLLYDIAGKYGVYKPGDPLLFGQLKDFYRDVAAAGQESDALWLRIAGVCMLFGFGAKAGAFPLHIWLPKAHPVAPAPASALLSGMLTKTGIYGILLLTTGLFFKEISWGNLILVLGTVTMALGAVLALFSVDLKRTLACSSVSQIGFILVGIGMSCLLGDENILAVRGSVLHMVNHSMIKLVLFLAAGVVFQNVHRLNLNEIRGFGRRKPLLHFLFLTGALGIGGIPLWNGYVSKTLLHESIVEYTYLLSEGQVANPVFSATGLRAVEWIFLISGGLTVAYMTKLCVAIFVEKNPDASVQERFDAMGGKYMSRAAAVALTLCAVGMWLIGLLPNLFAEKIAGLGQSLWGQMETQSLVIQWFSLTNLKGACISIAIGVAVYFGIVRTWMMSDGVYVNRWPTVRDLENLVYRPVLLKILPLLGGVICRIPDSLVDGLVVMLRKTAYRDSPIRFELQEGTQTTYLLGGILNRLRYDRDMLRARHVAAALAESGRVGEAHALLESARRKKNKKDYRHELALVHVELEEDVTIVARSLSFGLLLFCVGLLTTVVYLLFLA